MRSMATQSGDDAKKSTALAKLHLEDGTTLLARSFGSHESVEGEVRSKFITGYHAIIHIKLTLYS